MCRGLRAIAGEASCGRCLDLFFIFFNFFIFVSPMVVHAWVTKWSVWASPYCQDVEASGD